MPVQAAGQFARRDDSQRMSRAFVPRGTDNGVYTRSEDSFAVPSGSHFYRSSSILIQEKALPNIELRVPPIQTFGVSNDDCDRSKCHFDETSREGPGWGPFESV